MSELSDDGVATAVTGSPPPAVFVDGAESAEDDPEIVVSPSAAAAISTTTSANTSTSSHSSASSPPASPSASHSPLSSPTAAAAPPTSRRAASSGSGSSGNGYVSAQQKRANMDLTGLGSNPRSPPAGSDGTSSKGIPQSSSSSFLSSFAKKLTLNTAAANNASAAQTVASPTAPKPSPQAAMPATKAATATASSPPTGRLSGSSSAAPSMSLSASPPPSTATASSSASTASSSVVAPSSPTGASSSSSSSTSSQPPSVSSSTTTGSSKFSLSGSFGSMFRSLSDITTREGGSGSGSGGASSAAGGGLSQSEQQKADQKREWLSLLPPPSSNGVAVTPPPSQSFSNPKVKARCVKLAWFGIPSSVRGDAWQWIIGNSLNITEDLFWIMSGRAQEVKENKMRRLEREEKERIDGSNGSSEGGGSGGSSSSSSTQDSKAKLNREESVSIIDTDVSRTFPELKFFHDGGPLQAPLYQVLESYGCYRPDVGYVQGMSHIASMLLLNMEPLPAFVALCNLLNQDLYFKFFRMNAQQMALHLAVFQQVFKDQLPQLYAHFASLGIEPDMYLYDWLLTIFTRALPLDVTHRVWDNFLTVGHVFLFRTALGLLRLQQATFMQAEFEKSLALLNRPPRDIDGDALFECIGRITVTAERLNKMLQEAEG